MSVTIYHNPACGTSRNTLAMIRQSGEAPEVIEYLKDPPSRARLIELIQAMGISPRALLREKGTPYAELGLADPKWSDDELIDFMLEHPILINRPIVVTPKGTRLCRPSEAVLELLENPATSFVKEDGEWLRGEKAKPGSRECARPVACPPSCLAPLIDGGHGASAPLCLSYPTGKSLRFIGSDCQASESENISVFRKLKLSYRHCHPVPFRGALRKGHRCGTGMRWTRMALLTGAPEVDGEIVWSRHPKGWCQVRKPQAARTTVARGHGSPRRSRISRKPLRGECRVIPV